MTEARRVTAPEDRVSFLHRLAYGSGAFANNLLAGALGGLMVVLNLGLGMDPVLVGLLGGLPRFFDAVTDPIIGYISDNTRSRWGRRRPFIFIGAILVAICFAMLWQFPEGQSEMFYFWYFLIGSFIFFLAYTVFATPWVALGYELTPDYNERNLLMGTQNFIAQLAYLIPPSLLWMVQHPVFDDMVHGTSVVAIGIAVLVVVTGVIPPIFLRERLAGVAAQENLAAHADDTGPAVTARIWDFMKGFAEALAFIPFLKLCLATFLVFNGFIMIAAFGFYVTAYYVFAGDTVAAAELSAYLGWAGVVCTFIVVAVVTWMANRFGKRTAFIIATGLATFGYAIKWFCYNPEAPYLLFIPAPFLAFGLGGLFTLMPSMMADIVDRDELRTHQRREGMFASIYWWVVKLGQGAATAIGGYLLANTGFDVALGGAQTEETLLWLRIYDIGLPIVFYLTAILLIATLDVSREKSEAVRAELEARRGAPDPHPAE